MSDIDHMELIDKFVEDSLSREELNLFNKKYNEDTEFAALANSYLDMSIAVKAIDRYSKRRMNDKNVVNSIFIKSRWLLSMAASIAIITTLTFYALHLNNENQYLSNQNNKINADITKLTQELEFTKALRKTDSVETSKTQTIVSSIEDDRRYFSTILALNKIVVTNINKNITRNSEDESHVFPLQSKLVNPNNAFITILNQNFSKILKFHLIDFASNDTIFSMSNISKETIPLNKSGMLPGGKYFWLITYQNGNEESGIINMISASEKKKVKEFSLKTGNDYLEAFIYYYNHKYFFEAQSVLNKAKHKYPGEPLFQEILGLLYNTTTL